MPYDALGNYIPGDEPSIDQMQYELAKKGQAPRPLDKVTEHFKNIVTQFNPIMMPKVMQDVGTIGTNIASTIVSPYADILSNVQASGAAGLHRLAGNEQAALEAEARQRQVTPSGLMREPTLPVVREFEQGLGKAFEASKLPPMGPGSGMPGSAPVSPRPMFTPNDLRVVGAEATRVGRQIGDIPTDFANAQSGFQRIDPVTGQPVIGARIQSGVDRLGDIMEQRKMQGLTPIPGLPAALQPETSMYAVRPQGSRLTTPVVPETARGFSPPIDPANDMYKEVVGLDPERSEVTPTLLHSLNNRVQFNDVPNDRDAINGFRSFMQNKAQEMYPEAETPRQALEIFNAMHYDTPSRHAVENKMFDEFIQTPEGQQLLPNAVSSDEMAKRHGAATEGLKNMWGKYLVKNLGTEGNPLVKIAAEKGLTQLPAEDVIRVANEEAYAASANRQKAGMPIQGSFAIPIAGLKQEIEAISLPLQNAASAEQSLGQAAHIAGVDPASVPEYLEARKNAAKLNKQKNELQKKLDNLTLASAYEVLEDAAVKPASAETLLKEMQPSERGFYPGLKESAARGETSYKSAIGAIENTGFIQAAEKFYNDVLQGKIPADKAATYPVDKYIRENAEARIKVEQAEKAKLEGHKTAVVQSLKDSANALPADKKFGNVGVVELTKDTPVDIANREVAASTEALDICIGEGGSGSGTKNLFTGKKDPRYTPIVNLLTGEPNPNASRNISSYVESLQRGEQLPMFRDMETGMPIAALQFHVASSVGANGQPKYNIGYASGAGNGRIDTKYVNGVRDYLNSRADDIAGIGNNLEDNTGIYDTKNKPSLSKARRYAQVSENQMKAVDWNTMPRFMTANDVKQAVQTSSLAPAVSNITTNGIDTRLAAINAIDGVIDEAVLNSGLEDSSRLESTLRNVLNGFASDHLTNATSFNANPVEAINTALLALNREITSYRSGSPMQQEAADALEQYATGLGHMRDDISRGRVQLQTPQMQPAEQLQQAMAPRLFAGNARVVNEALQEYSSRLQDYAANQLQNGMSPVEIADNVRTKVNEYRNMVLRGPTINTQNFVSDELSEYVSELRQMIDNIGRWIETQNQQAAAPQTANLPAEVQQNIDRRNQYITNAYQTALTPNTRDASVDAALSEFSDLLDGMATNMFGNGYNASEIAENLADRVHAEHMALVTPDRIDARGLTPFEADMIRSRLNDAYGNLRTIHEMGVPAPEPMVELDFESDTMHGANQYTATNIIDMARELFEQERMDANNFDIPSIEDSIHALQAGVFDDERIRQLPEQQRQPFADDVAFRLQNMLDDINARNRRPNQVLVAEPGRAREAIDNAIANIDNDYGIDVANNVLVVINAISEHVNPGDELSEYVYQLRRNRPGMSQDVREGLDHVADELESVSQERMNLNTAYNTAESYFNELLDDLSSDQRFADLDDDIRITMVDEQQRALADRLIGLSDDEFLQVMRRLRENRPIPNEGNRQAAQPVLPAPATAPYTPIPAIIHAMSDQAITADMTFLERNRVQNMFESLTDVNSPEELQNIVSLARSYAMGGWDNFSDVQREWLARNIEEYVRDNTTPNTPPPEVATITDRDRELYTELNDMLDNAIEEGYPLPGLGDNEAVARLILNDEVGGDINNATDAERRRLASLVRRYGAHGTLPRGHKKGGRIRKYQDGGSTSDYGEPNNAALDAFDLMKLERWMSKRPEFRVDSKEFNDNTPDLERDDDAQVPRESTFDAKLKTPWEDDKWMQKNFNYRYRGKTFAKGGTVQPIPSVEQMKYELMKRS